MKTVLPQTDFNRLDNPWIMVGKELAFSCKSCFALAEKSEPFRSKIETVNSS